ncbi:MAG: ArsR/SmtB family transcription factor [Desulfococcaceae bacterium]
MKDFIRVMKALSDPGRVKIVKMLWHKTMCVCELRAALELSQPAVSKHLKILEDAGLVTFKKDGLWVNYSLAEGSNPYAETLLSNLENWLNEDAEIEKLVKRIPFIRREEICRR